MIKKILKPLKLIIDLQSYKFWNPYLPGWCLGDIDFIYLRAQYCLW